MINSKYQKIYKEFLKNYQSEQEAKKKMLQNKQDELHIRIRETTQFILYLEKEDERIARGFDITMKLEKVNKLV